MTNLQDMFENASPKNFVRRRLSDEHRAKISAGNKGKKRSEETRAKISAANKGRKQSEEHRAKISHSQNKPLMTLNGIFPSVKQACLSLNISSYALRKYMKQWPEQYYYIKKELA